MHRAFDVTVVLYNALPTPTRPRLVLHDSINDCLLSIVSQNNGAIREVDAVLKCSIIRKEFGDFIGVLEG